MRSVLDRVIAVLLHAVLAHEYLTLFAAITIEEAGIPLPVPGDLIIAFYGWRTDRDPFEIARVVLTCALASTLGTLVPYWLARRFGRGVADKAAGWLDVDPAHLDRMYAWIDRHGFRAVLATRLVPGLRVGVSLVAGTARVPALAFASGVFVAAAIYWTAWVLLGAFVGPRVVDTVSPAYLRVIVVLIPAALVVAFAVRVLVARLRRATSGGTRGGRA